MKKTVKLGNGIWKVEFVNETMDEFVKLCEKYEIDIEVNDTYIIIPTYESYKKIKNHNLL